LIVVLDTNVWISALVFSKPGSVPIRALERAVNEDTLATSRELRAEIHRILTERNRWTQQRTTLRLDNLLAGAITVQLTHTTHVCRDPKDNMFLECAAIAHADMIVAGDKDLLVLGSYAGTRIVTPFEYLNLES
jgi:putative PIN family toxin of toxin-antitoxin system